MSENLIVKKFNGQAVHTFVWNDKPAWIATEIVNLFDYADATKTIQDCISAEKFESGTEYETLKGEDLKKFKKLVNYVTTEKVVSSKTPNLTVFYEEGIYGVLEYMHKPEGVAFRKWLRREVVPEISKTGAYISDKATITSMTEYQKLMMQTRRENIGIRKARELERLSKKYEGQSFAQVLDSYATKELTGEHLIPLPATKKSYSAGEIGDMFCITATAVGIIANKNGLKIEKKTGEYRNDKSRSSNKEVSNFYYYDCVLPAFERLAAQWKADHAKTPSKKSKSSGKAA